MRNKNFAPLRLSTRDALAKLMTECGEVITAAGYSLQHGLLWKDPDLPIEKQETNRGWLLREIVDLARAIEHFHFSLVNDGESLITTDIGDIPGEAVDFFGLQPHGTRSRQLD